MIARHAYQTFQSLPLELPRTADVSPSAVTFRGRKLLILFADGQNRTQEADGSIPFISTIFLLFFLTRGSAAMEILRIITASGGDGPIGSRRRRASASQYGEHPPLVSAGDRFAREVAFARGGLRLVTEGLRHDMGRGAPRSPSAAQNRVENFSVCRVGNYSPCTICKRPLSRIGTVALTASSRRTRRSTGNTGGANGHRRLRPKDLQGS
jgi:hypothetical protein